MYSSSTPVEGYVATQPKDWISWRSTVYSGHTQAHPYPRWSDIYSAHATN